MPIFVINNSTPYKFHCGASYIWNFVGYLSTAKAFALAKIGKDITKTKALAWWWFDRDAL